MDLLHCSALSPPHADVEQLSTTVAPQRCRAINHPQLDRAQTEQPPPGMDKCVEGGSDAEGQMKA